ncbi:hypothetical protein SCB71_20285 [Herbiconiux sp. KACC 21604]|uniref:hypothetical protein n=1 Tax=unclassified Herbiconiux TaxID=2618217 RepID=UPI001493017A|nr:hypothetical protein [Herbiconiux sp. SALV-R1]QJU55364.1 hypothetical protein HL652_18210 [Herbiconiux sp. SALV-R1]WPO86535.1 hypothetical protein SCB71_20285 [Herbiconiux sp. KACC 21604]
MTAEQTERLTAIARELCALRPTEFTAARNARAAALKSDGDRELAALVRAFPRPTAAAWAVNALDSERPGEVDAALDLGERMRDATERVDRDSIRELSRERQRLLADLARSVRELAEEFDVGLSPTAVTEVQQSFQAALADPAAADAVRSGMLVRAISGDGLEPTDLEGAFAVDGARGASRRSGTSPARPRSGAAHDADESATARSSSRAGSRSSSPARAQPANRPSARERAREALERDHAAAAADAQRASDALAEIDLSIDELASRREGLLVEIDDLEQRLAETHNLLDATATEAARLRKARAAAERTAASADRELARFRKRLDALTDADTDEPR